MTMVFVNVGKPRAESKEPTFTGELKNAVPRGLGQTVQGIGQVAEDLGWEDNPIKAYGQRVIDHHYATFTEACRAGVWTKADSVTYFDDLRAEAP